MNPPKEDAEAYGRWSKSGALGVAKMILGNKARVGMLDGRCVLWMDTPGGRVYIGSAPTWQDLIRSVFVEPLRPKEPYNSRN